MASEVVAALRAANLQVAAGAINQAPAQSGGAFTLSVQTLGRLTSVEEFENIVVRADADGSVLRLRDVARVELGSQDYTVNAYLNNKTATAIVVFQRPGSNALSTAENIRNEMKRLAATSRPGLAIRLSTTRPTSSSSRSTQWSRRSGKPRAGRARGDLVFADLAGGDHSYCRDPVSLIGSFAIMAAVGVSFNTLSLLGLVLAIGIVVDDAIVVVENVERYLAKGYTPRDGRLQDHGRGRRGAACDIAGADRRFPADGLHHGPPGLVLRQFAIVIAGSTAISLLCRSRFRRPWRRCS